MGWTVMAVGRCGSVRSVVMVLLFCAGDGRVVGGAGLSFP